MRKEALLLVTILLCIGTAGCGKATQTASEKESMASEAVSSASEEDIEIEVGAKQLEKPEPATEAADPGETQEPSETEKGYSSFTEGDITINFKDYSETFADEKGTKLLEFSGNQPSVSVKGNQVAADKINAYYKAQNEELLKTAEDYKDYAEESLALGSAGLPYFVENFYKNKRLDTAVISIVKAYSEFTGGAHPNSVTTGENFDTATGNLLTFADIVTDEGKARKLVEQSILEQSEKMITDKGNPFFEGYESMIPELLRVGSWYFDEKGLVIIANAYDIAPYAAGSFEFRIPYDAFTFLKEEYRPVK